MTRVTARWTTGIAVTALLALPVSGWGQVIAPTPSAQTASPSTESQETAAHQHRLALEHLHEAQAELAGLSDDALTAPARAKIAELKRYVSTLQQTDAAAATTSPAGTFAAIDRLLSELLGSESAGTPRADAPVGTSGAAAPALVEGNAKAILQKVRTHLTAYAGAAGSVDAIESADAVTAGVTRSSSGAPPTADSASPSTSPTDPTPSPTGTAATAEPQIPAPPDHAAQPGESAQTSDAPPFDAERVKLHLTAARNALADMTRLPAAAELSGESRTQVSQLITDFNEMIASETAWQQSLDKVKANLQTILAAPADERPSLDATAPEAVGTSGRTGLDPEIRTKLVEFRSHLEAFEAAVTAGARAVGTISAHDAEQMDPPSTVASRDTSTGQPAPSGADVPSGDAPQQALAGASGGTTYPGPPADRTASADMEASRQSGAAPTEAGGRQRDALRHIEAIEALLTAAPAADRAAAARTDGAPRAVGTSGTTAPPLSADTVEPGLDAAQIVEIREHLRQLRELLQEAR